jgi:hypothetical protein
LGFAFRVASATLFFGSFYLGRNANPGLKVNARPDEVNRLSSDIDAIAGPFAIEHSSIDTVLNQRRDSAWFLKVVKVLEDSSVVNYRSGLS